MKTVLILEDDVSNLQVFSALLWAAGYRVLEAANGQEAIALGQNRCDPIHLLVSDVMVPDRSGTDVALELMQSRPAMPILFVSGSPIGSWDPNDRWNLAQLPVDRVAFLEKPFLATTLLNTIDELLK